MIKKEEGLSNGIFAITIIIVKLRKFFNRWVIIEKERERKRKKERERKRKKERERERQRETEDKGDRWQIKRDKKELALTFQTWAKFKRD